jgi:hypothetical protein
MRAKLKPFYDKQGSIYCRAVQDNVIFNNYGWQHLVRHKNKQPRKPDDKRMRLYLLSWVPEAVKYCKSVNKTTMEKQLFGGVELNVIYFELVRTFPKRGKRNEVSIELILRKIEDNPIHYWSVRYHGKQKSSR